MQPTFSLIAHEITSVFSLFLPKSLPKNTFSMGEILSFQAAEEKILFFSQALYQQKYLFSTLETYKRFFFFFLSAQVNFY